MVSAMTHRGTTNTNARGGTPDRRARKRWLLDTFGDGTHVACFDCGDLLAWDTLTVSRILPGCLGGTYVRGNIRPACLADAIKQSNAAKERKRILEGRPPGHKRGCRHCRMVTEYRLAREAAHLAREAATGMYASEQAEYGPIVTFKEWLIGNRGAGQEEWGEWTA